MKTVALGALNDELLTLCTSIFMHAASADGKAGDAACEQMCSSELLIPQFIMTALSISNMQILHYCTIKLLERIL